MNALKVLAGIPQETDLVSAASIEPIQTLKTNYLGGKNPRLHTDEILIALSSSAASSELAAAAMHQLPNLKGCDVHSTVLLSSVDSSTLNRLGMYLTCDPVYEEEDRKYHSCKIKETGKHPGQRRQALTGVLLLASCTQLWYTCSA